MVTIEEVGQMLQDLADKLNQKKRARKKIVDWIGYNYYGKIIGWNLGKKSYHLVFMKDGSVKFKEGEYPACDTIFMTDPDTWIGICTLKVNPKNAMMKNKLWLRGNFHELFIFMDICGKYMISLGQKYAKN
ncbi:MAG: SCP2 sterol-binding domain-containing protein [Promethearchaeota archaeon]